MPQNKYYFVYILANKPRGVLYTGVTNNLERRIFEHKNNVTEGFTSKYHVYNLVYYEACVDVSAAIWREKCIKKWNREWKIKLIEKQNPSWKDLYDDIKSWG